MLSLDNFGFKDFLEMQEVKSIISNILNISGVSMKKLIILLMLMLILITMDLFALYRGLLRLSNLRVFRIFYHTASFANITVDLYLFRILGVLLSTTLLLVEFLRRLFRVWCPSVERGDITLGSNRGLCDNVLGKCSFLNWIWTNIR